MPPSRCDAAIKVSRPLRSVEAAVEVFEAAADVLRLLSRCDAGVQVSRSLSNC
jgi:hypothetical protein